MIRAAALRVLALAAIAGAAAACASAPEQPAWFEDRRAELDAQGTPDLRAIPRGTDATTSAAHWAAVRAEMERAEAVVKASPRNEPLPEGSEPDPAFEAEARREIEQTGQTYQ